MLAAEEDESSHYAGAGIQLRRYDSRPSGLSKFELKDLVEMRPVYHHQPKSVRVHICCHCRQRAIQNSQSKVTNVGCVCGFGLRGLNGAAVDAWLSRSHWPTPRAVPSDHCCGLD